MSKEKGSEKVIGESILLEEIFEGGMQFVEEFIAFPRQIIFGILTKTITYILAICYPWLY